MAERIPAAWTLTGFCFTPGANLAYSNIYSSMRNPYATAGSRDPEGNGDADYSPTGYERYRRNPGKGETPGNTLEPIYGHAPPPAVQNGTTTSPEAVMSGGISGSTAPGAAAGGGAVWG